MLIEDNRCQKMSKGVNKGRNRPIDDNIEGQIAIAFCMV